jgi:hypothetical protein
VRHMLPAPSAVEREAALDALSGATEELRAWPTHVFDGDGHYLVIPPRVARELRGGGTDLVDWQSVPSSGSGTGAAYWLASQIAASLRK